MLLVETEGGEHVIVIESQTVPDLSRKYAWPYYVAYLYNRYRCPVTLVVVTAGLWTADWARRPIHVGMSGAITHHRFDDASWPRAPPPSRHLPLRRPQPPVAAAAAVLRVLETRGLAIPESVSRRVRECTDLTLLGDLQTRAVTIEDARDLFADL